MLSGSNRYALLVSATLLLGLPGARLGNAQELTVSSALSLKEALDEIARAFESANPGVEVRLNLGASGDLQRQIEAGAPVDAFVSAAARNMDVLVERGAVDARTRRDIACNRLVVVTPAGRGSAPSDLAGLVAAERISLGNPKTVPAGEYAREALRAGGLWDGLSSKLVYAENVRQALEYVARGEVDAAFVYRTDAGVAADEVRVAFEVDPRNHAPIVYPAAVVAGSRRRELARRFVEFLGGDAGRAALESHGFLLPPCAQGVARPKHSTSSNGARRSEAGH